MAIARLPAYVRPMKLAGDKTGYYFELPAWARPTKDRKTGKLTAAVRHGQACPVISTALGTDLAQVHAKGAALNDALRDWRTGKMGQRRIAEGSVAWLFQWYREQERFIKNKAKTRKDYKALMDMLVAFEPIFRRSLTLVAVLPGAALAPGTDVGWGMVQEGAAGLRSGPGQCGGPQRHPEGSCQSMGQYVPGLRTRGFKSSIYPPPMPLVGALTTQT